MDTVRTPIPWIVLPLWGATLLPAQLAPGEQAPAVEVTRWLRGEGVAWGTEDAPALTLFGVWEPGSEDFLENAAYLAELQRKYRDRGLRVAGVLYGVAEPVVPVYADFALGLDPKGATSADWRQGDRSMPGPIFWLIDARGAVVWHGKVEMGLAGSIERILDGKFSARDAQLRANVDLNTLLAFADTHPETIGKSIDGMLDYNPLNGLAWSFRFAFHVERSPDTDRAHPVAKDAFVALAGHSSPMGLFADRALRTDPHDVELAKLAVTAMTPLAPLAEGDLRFQFALLRALQRSGNHRQAGLLSRQLAKTVEARPERLLEFVEVLADAPEAAVNADTARRALELAEEAGVGRGKFLTGTTFKFLDRCLGDRKAALKVAEEWMAKLGDRTAINNEAWYLMVNEPEKGRFGGLALVLCERLLESRDSMDYFELDTAALGVFLGGRRAEQAIELQKAALEKAGGPDAKPAYVERLKRFEAARRRGEAR